MTMKGNAETVVIVKICSNCRTENVVYECAVITNEHKSSENIYRGATENEFKARYPTPVLSFNSEKYRNSTELPR